MNHPVDPLSALYNVESIAGRAYVPHVDTRFDPKTRKCRWALCGEHGEDKLEFMTLWQDDFTKDQAFTVCKLLVDELNRWPDMNDLSYVRGAESRGKGRAAANALLVTIIAQEFAERELQVYAPSLDKRLDGINWYYKLKTVRFDPQNTTVFQG